MKTSAGKQMMNSLKFSQEKYVQLQHYKSEIAVACYCKTGINDFSAIFRLCKALQWVRLLEMLTGKRSVIEDSS